MPVKIKSIILGKNDVMGYVYMHSLSQASGHTLIKDSIFKFFTFSHVSNHTESKGLVTTQGEGRRGGGFLETKQMERVSLAPKSREHWKLYSFSLSA